MRVGRLLPFVWTLAACGGEPPAGGAIADGSGSEVPSADVAARPAPLDPATLHVGDTVLGLTVESLDLARVLEDSLWVGSVVFVGDLVVHGIYQRHPDWPQVDLPCVDVVQAASQARIPRFPPDLGGGGDRGTWFCLDEAALAFDLLGSPEPAREVVVALDRYRLEREPGGGLDLARLSEVIETGPEAQPTLEGR